MAYYDALVSVWTAGKPASATGATFAAGAPAATKLTAINGWTVVSPQPVNITARQIFDALDATELISALGVPVFSAVQLAFFNTLVTAATAANVNAGPGSFVRVAATRLFNGKTNCLSGLTSLIAQFDNATTPWYLSVGYTQEIGTADLTLAGLS